MNKLILPLAIIVPVAVIALVYFLWFAPKAGKKDVIAKAPDGKKVNLVVSEKNSEKGLGQFGESDKGKSSEEKLLDANRPVKASKPLVEKYIENSGIANEFYELDSMLDKQIEQMVAGSELSESEKEKIARLFVNHIKGEDLLEAYKEAFAREFSDEEVEQLMEINNDPVVKKVAEEAQMKGDPEQMREQVEEFFQDLSKNPASKEREDLVYKIAKSGKNAEFLADVTLGMVENLGQHLGPDDHAPSKEELETFRSQISEEAFGNVMSALMFQTRNLSDKELSHFGKLKSSDVSDRESELRKGVAKSKTSALFQELGKTLKNDD